MSRKGPRKARHRRVPQDSAYAGPVTCLRCDHEFQSWDRRQNRLCPSCLEAIGREPSEEPRASYHPPKQPRNRDGG
jgi:hypothetical protein